MVVTNIAVDVGYARVKAISRGKQLVFPCSVLGPWMWRSGLAMK